MLARCMPSSSIADQRSMRCLGIFGRGREGRVVERLLVAEVGVVGVVDGEGMLTRAGGVDDVVVVVGGGGVMIGEGGVYGGRDVEHGGRGEGGD